MAYVIALVCMQIFKKAVMEAKNATCDIQTSIAEQKHMLALSAQQHEEVGPLFYLIILVIICTRRNRSSYKILIESRNKALSKISSFLSSQIRLQRSFHL